MLAFRLGRHSSSSWPLLGRQVVEILDNTESAHASPADRLPRAGEGLQVAHSNHQGWLGQARKGMVRSQLIGAENRALALDASEGLIAADRVE